MSKHEHHHDGHRSRLKERFLKNGFEGFAEHEVLEYLLFFSIPYKDTNALAHDLIDRFGSFAAVCDTDYHELLQVNGIGPNTAQLLKTVGPLCGYYRQNDLSAKEIIYPSEDMKEYIKSLFIGRPDETAYVIHINSKGKLVYTDLIATGSAFAVSLSSSQVVKSALAHRASGTIMAHNHPSGYIKPSINDVRVTRDCYNALKVLDVILVDHYIVCGDEILSFKDEGLMKF